MGIHVNNLKSDVESIFLEERLNMQLGFEPNTNIKDKTISPHVANIQYGIPDQMLIYTDIIEPTFVGHERAYILKIVNTQPKHLKFGDSCYKEFSPLQYMVLEKREFEAITIDLRDYAGLFMPFQHGVFTIKLHFKKQDE